MGTCNEDDECPIYMNPTSATCDNCQNWALENSNWISDFKGDRTRLSDKQLLLLAGMYKETTPGKWNADEYTLRHGEGKGTKLWGVFSPNCGRQLDGVATFATQPEMEVNAEFTALVHEFLPRLLIEVRITRSETKAREKAIELLCLAIKALSPKLEAKVVSNELKRLLS